MSSPLEAPLQSRRRPMLALLADVLIRQASVGTVLWTFRNGGHQIAFALNLAVLGLTIAGTRHLGLTRPQGWGLTLREGVLVFIGGVCIAYLLTYLFGPPPWIQL